MNSNTATIAARPSAMSARRRPAGLLLRAGGALLLIAFVGAWQQGWLATGQPELHASAPTAPLRRGAAFLQPAQAASGLQQDSAGAEATVAPAPIDDGASVSLLTEEKSVPEVLDEEVYDEPAPPERPLVVPTAPEEPTPAATEVAMAVAPDSAPAVDPGEQPTMPAAPALKPPSELTSATPDGSHKLVDGHAILSIGDISTFEYKTPLERQAAASGELPAVPEAIARWNNQKVVMHGFMMPIEVEGNQVKSFVLVGTQLACCFGVTPKMNEWVYVTMEPGASSRYLPDLPVLVWGDFKVEEEMRRDTVLSLYRMTATRVDGPREWARAGWKF